MPKIDCSAYIDNLKNISLKKYKPMETQDHARLAVFSIGDNSVNDLYIKSKEKMAEDWGIELNHFHYKTSVRTNEICEHIRICNSFYDGIIIQKPTTLLDCDEAKCINRISFANDVDGLQGMRRTITAQGIIDLINSITEINGKTIAVVGRGKLVGKDLLAYYQNEPCTVIGINSNTPEITKKALLKTADIVISAVGVPNLFSYKDLATDKPVYVIDAGISRINGKQVGDFSHDGVDSEFNNHIYYTPWTGGIGKITVATLLERTVSNYLLKKEGNR